MLDLGIPASAHSDQPLSPFGTPGAVNAANPYRGASPPAKFIPKFSNQVRYSQRRRAQSLSLQVCLVEGRQVWQQAKAVQDGLGDGVRVDLPGPRVLGSVLGLARTGAMMPGNPMWQWELSAGDMAELLGYAKSTVEAALRWLGGDPIVYKGAWVAEGLGYIDRVRRKGKAWVDGVLKTVYRSSEIALTEMGRALVRVTGVFERWLARFAHVQAREPEVGERPDFCLMQPSRETAADATNSEGGASEVVAHAAEFDPYVQGEYSPITDDDIEGAPGETLKEKAANAFLKKFERSGQRADRDLTVVRRSRGDKERRALL